MFRIEFSPSLNRPVHYVNAYAAAHKRDLVGMQAADALNLQHVAVDPSRQKQRAWLIDG